MSSSFHDFLETAAKIVDWKASLRHDLAGHIYHRLLAESKYLGAYYTSIPTATLLLKLALPLGGLGNKWSDIEYVRGFRLADLACGTGTLLMASADAIVNNHVRGCMAGGGSPQLDALNDVMIKNTIHGYDVLSSALHLTASTLTLRSTGKADLRHEFVPPPARRPGRGPWNTGVLAKRDNQCHPVWATGTGRRQGDCIQAVRAASRL